MTLNGKHVALALRRIPGAYGGQVADLDTLAAGANAALLEAPPGLTTEGAAAFLATMSQESGSFRYLHEAGGATYLKAKPYWPYIGRTFEQVTHRDNYLAFGKWCAARGLLTDPQAFVRDPESLGRIQWAWLGGVWYWQVNGIWPYANRGDFLATQQAVNLGVRRIGSNLRPSGITARNNWYKAWLNLGSVIVPEPSSTITKGPPLMAATNAQQVYLNNTTPQVLPPGEHALKINDKGDYTLVVGPNEAVDITVGARVTSELGGILRMVLVDYISGGKTTTHHERIGQSFPPGKDVEVLASFAGSIGPAPDKGHTLRLRAVIESAGEVTVSAVQPTGYKL